MVTNHDTSQHNHRRGEEGIIRVRERAMNTPDTEWEKEALKTCKDCTHWMTDDNSYACNNCIISLLSSRDTYWKERVRKEVEGIDSSAETYEERVVVEAFRQDVIALLRK